eukprot:COSAG04_NODE_2592_length_3879_cov_15.585979_6_plen_87_part_00
MLLLHCPTASGPPQCSATSSSGLKRSVRSRPAAARRPPRPSEPEAEAEDGDAEGEISAESGDFAAQFQARFCGLCRALRRRRPRCV